MLGKLIKFELKATYKFVLLVHGLLLLLASIISGFLWFQGLNISGDYVSIFAYSALTFLIAIIYALLLVGSFIGTPIYLGLRFYRNLFSDEGYLTHTLPVTTTQLIYSKLITGLIWSAFNLVIVGISILFLFSAYLVQFAGISDLMGTILSLLTFSNIGYLGISLLNCIYNLLMIYACVCLGQLFHKNRRFAAVVFYGLLNLVIQGLISFVTVLGNTSMNMITAYLYTGSISQALSVLNIGLSIFLMYILPSIIFYIICQFIISKKLNLQ